MARYRLQAIPSWDGEVVGESMRFQRVRVRFPGCNPVDPEKLIPQSDALRYRLAVARYQRAMAEWDGVGPRPIPPL